MEPVTLALVAAGSFGASAAAVDVLPGGRRQRDLTIPIAATALAAGVAGALAGASPTGLEGIDLAYRVGLSVAFAVVGSKAGRLPLVVCAAFLAALGLDSPAGWLAFAALGIAASRFVVAARRRFTGLVAGALLGQAALRLGGPDALGASAAAVAVVLVVLSVSALSKARAGTKRRTVLAVGGGVLAVVLAGVAAVVAGLMSVSDLEEGRAAARDGLTAAEDGRAEEAGTLLGGAADAFARADGRLSAWWARPALAIPVLGQNLRAAQRLARTGADIAGAGAFAAAQADLDEARLRAGTIDLELVRDLQVPLERVRRALEESEGVLAERSPWLAPPVEEAMDELGARVAEARPRADDAAAAAAVAPALLGGDGQRRYFVSLQTPAEARGSGGILGNFAEITATDGRLELVRTGRAGDLNTGGTPESRRLVDPPTYLVDYDELTWQDLTLSPDFPTVARTAEALYPRYGGVAVDGVLSLDPYAVAALLRLTGPISVPEWPEPLTGDNAADILLRQQYLAFDQAGGEQRVEFLDSVIRAVFDRLLAGELPGPSELADVLGPVVRSGRIKLHSTRREEQAVFERSGAAGVWDDDDGDYVGLVTQNGGLNKIDLFLERSLDYRARFDPATGQVTATATITLRNTAPAEGFPDYVIGGPRAARGTNLSLVSLYSPLRLVRATLDGMAADFPTRAEEGPNAYNKYVEVPAGATVEIVMELAGPLDAGNYSLAVRHQPTVNPDAVSVSVTFAERFEATIPGETAPSADGVQETFMLEAERRFAVDITSRGA